MSVPPEREAPAWEVRGDRPSERAPAHKPDRVGTLMVGALLVAVIVALVLVVLL